KLHGEELYRLGGPNRAVAASGDRHMGPKLAAARVHEEMLRSHEAILILKYATGKFRRLATGMKLAFQSLQAERKPLVAGTVSGSTIGHLQTEPIRFYN